MQQDNATRHVQIFFDFLWEQNVNVMPRPAVSL